jgi:hypothetical protein
LTLKLILIAFALVLVGACGQMQNIPSSAPPLAKDANTVVINQPFEQVWSHAIPQVGKSFFAINNIDKNSGILNISYDGDPEQYVDCGTIHSEYGAEKIDFPAAKAHQDWLGPSGGILPANYSRTVTLAGRMNIVFEHLSETSTKVTVNARYVLNISTTTRVGQVPPTSPHETIMFNSGGEATLEHGACRPNGKFEHDVLAMIQ